MTEEQKRLVEELSALTVEELEARLPRGKSFSDMTVQEKATVVVYLSRRKKVLDANPQEPPKSPDVGMSPTVCAEPGGESKGESAPAIRRGGPVTEEGKAVVSQNAFKHGLRATDSVLIDCLGESEREAFQRVREAVWDDVRPMGVLEELLTDKLVMIFWRQLRLYLLDRAVFASSMKKWPNWVEPEQVQGMERLGRYEACLERSFKTTLHELQRLQAARRGQPVPPLVAADLEVRKG